MNSLNLLGLFDVEGHVSPLAASRLGTAASAAEAAITTATSRGRDCAKADGNAEWEPIHLDMEKG